VAEWLVRNWKELIAFWGNDDFTNFNNMLQSLVSRFLSQKLTHTVHRLFIEKEDPLFFIPPRAAQSVLKGLEKAQQRMLWLEKHAKDVQRWLQSH
jgi:hypothetical protein